MALFETRMYNRSLLLGDGFSRMGVDDTAAFTSSKALSHSMFHLNLSASPEPSLLA